VPPAKQNSPVLQFELAGIREPAGTIHPVEPSGAPQLHYDHPHGKLYCGDSLAWLNQLESGSVDLVFADPPYNAKKADWDNFESHDHYVKWSKEWLEQASSVLKKTGTLYVCGFSEVLADVKVAAMPFFKGCRWIVWHYKLMLRGSPQLNQFAVG
jgi:site-specific DNA-methyltransferase (adenine-specific)